MTMPVHESSFEAQRSLFQYAEGRAKAARLWIHAEPGEAESVTRRPAASDDATSDHHACASERCAPIESTSDIYGCG
jgi:hypothetical protein